MNTKLIILRGPSGSGKSTVTKKLIENSARRIATIEQDMFRHRILHNQTDAREISALMMKHVIITALECGYDVIADGIFNISHSKILFEEILAAHKYDNHIYYFNVSSDETIRRHQTRSKKDEFGEEEMKKWYVSSGPLGYIFEKEIPESMTLDQIVEFIVDDAKLND